jgi:hypothetical protein
MCVLQKKLILTQNPNAAIFASYFEVAGRSGRKTEITMRREYYRTGL